MSTAVKKTYDHRAIAWELECTALGDGYFGNALYVSKGIPGLSADELSLLDRYLTGNNAGMDHVELQALAQRIRNLNEEQKHVR